MSAHSHHTRLTSNIRLRTRYKMGMGHRHTIDTLDSPVLVTVLLLLHTLLTTRAPNVPSPSHPSLTAASPAAAQRNPQSMHGGHSTPPFSRRYRVSSAIRLRLRLRLRLLRHSTARMNLVPAGAARNTPCTTAPRLAAPPRLLTPILASSSPPHPYKAAKSDGASPYRCCHLGLPKPRLPSHLLICLPISSSASPRLVPSKLPAMRRRP